MQHFYELRLPSWAMRMYSTIPFSSSRNLLPTLLEHRPAPLHCCQVVTARKPGKVTMIRRFPDQMPPESALAKGSCDFPQDG